MPSNPPIRLSGPLGWAIAGVAAAAVFAAGALTARAFFDGGGDSPPAAGGASPGISAPFPTRTPFGRPAIPAAAGSPGIGGAGGEDAASSKLGYGMPYQCQAPLPASALGISAIDLEAAGIQPRVPRDGFELTSVSLAAVADCDDQGQPTGTPRPMLSTSWRHTATGLEAYLSQVASSEPLAPVLRSDGAVFAALGYHFSIYVNSYPVRPYDTAKPYPSGPDPRAPEVLRELISKVAPGFDQQCFWTVTDADWSALAAFGVGDPRPAIPSGLALSEVHITAFREPAAGCDTSVKPTEGFGLYAYWNSDQGDSLGVSVTGLPAGADASSPGYIDQYSASWASRGLQFSVWYGGKDGSGSADVIRAVAKALDPSFSDACFVRQRTLTEADIQRLGFRAPVPPAGYTVTRSASFAMDIDPGCQRPQGFAASYSLSWTLEKGADVIDVAIYASPGASASGEFFGWISDYGIGWVTADGTSYNVNAYSKGINPAVSRDDLIAVAKSLDPALDIEKLEKQAGGGAVPPRPAPDAPDRGN